MTHAMFFATDADCAVGNCSAPPTLVRHATAGIYAPGDPHFCDKHWDILTTDEQIETWSRGWVAGYKAGQVRALLDAEKALRLDAHNLREQAAGTTFAPGEGMSWQTHTSRTADRLADHLALRASRVGGDS